MNNDHLVVAEIFGPTFQGEGPSLGQRAFFLRLGGCNLTCSWCDTQYTWNAERYNLQEELTTMTILEVYERLVELGYTWRDLLVITGGEPLLQASRIDALLAFLDEERPTYVRTYRRVEIETNGTIAPTEAMVARTALSFNVSPKLLSSGQKFPGRRIQQALIDFSIIHSARFKFVVTSPVDILEVEELVKSLRIPADRVWIMPEGVTKESVEAKFAWIAPMALERGWNMTTRLHVSIWSSARGH